jgi:glycosyltransferase involved in cell wall biosynthesis
MRVLIAAGIYPPDPGGPALHAKKQFEWFEDKGMSTEVIAFRDYRSLPKIVRHFAYFFKVLSRLKSYDVVYAHDAISAGLPAFLAARLMNKKFIVRIGGDVAWERETSEGKSNFSMMEWYKSNSHLASRKYKVSKWVISKADKVIVPSKLLRDLYDKYYGAKNVIVIHNPLPNTRMFKQFEIPKTIVYASRLVSYKNLPFVLNVLGRVLPEYPDTRFQIMGDGPERKSLEALARNLDISDQVIFTGNITQKEVSESISKSYMGLAPALTEFNPNYILECISYGKPILVSKENGLPFELPDTFLFDPRDEEEFETQLRFLLTVEGHRQAVELAKKIDFSKGWEEVLEENFEAIKSIF